MMTHRKKRGLLRCLVLAALCTPAVHMVVQASNADTMHDIPAEIIALRNARDEIRYRHQAEADVAQAKHDLQQSRQNAAEAVTARKEAAANLVTAKENVRTLSQNLSQTRQSLTTAQTVLAERMQAVEAAQQAVEAYGPELERAKQDAADKQQVYDALESQAQTVSQEYEEAVKNAEASQKASREQLVAEAVNAVGYELNRLEEAQAMVDAQETDLSEDVEKLEQGYDEQLNSLDTQMESASDELDAAQEALDAVQEQMDALEEAWNEAKELEEESRQEVENYQYEISNLVIELGQAQKDEREAEQYDREAQDWMNRAVSAEGQMAVTLQLQEYAFEHLGEWAGWSTGIEYYHWKGEHTGHQLFLPITYAQQTRIRGRKTDIGISTGYLRSDTGISQGTASGMADTQVSVAVHNDHVINSIRYLLDFNLPTGQHRFYQHAVVPEGLARFTDFGAGFEVTPGVEVIHHYNDEDSLIWRMQYTFRNAYEYSKEIKGRNVSPGDIFHEELTYQHAGPMKQYSIQVRHSSSSSASQDSIFLDELGTWHAGNVQHYTDGDEWGLRLFYNRSLTDTNELSLYTIQNFTEKTKGFASDDAYVQYYGAGWMHHFDEKREWHAWIHYKDASSSYDPLRLDLNSTGYKRFSLAAGYSWQYAPTETLSLDVERYRRHNKHANSYQGWGIIALYQKTL